MTAFVTEHALFVLRVVGVVAQVQSTVSKISGRH